MRPSDITRKVCENTRIKAAETSRQVAVVEPLLLLHNARNTKSQNTPFCGVWFRLRTTVGQIPRQMSEVSPVVFSISVLDFRCYNKRIRLLFRICRQRNLPSTAIWFARSTSGDSDKKNRTIRGLWLYALNHSLLRRAVWSHQPAISRLFSSSHQNSSITNIYIYSQPY